MVSTTEREEGNMSPLADGSTGDTSMAVTEVAEEQAREGAEPPNHEDSSDQEDGEASEEEADSSKKIDARPSSQQTSDPKTDAPPLPNEDVPPLPAEPPPAATDEDDGWAPVWEETAQAFYFFNRFTGATQWTNPRVPEVAQPGHPVVEASLAVTAPPPTTGYNPAIHGDYDPTAWYAQPSAPEPVPGLTTDPAAQYTATAAFNRFTGRYQVADLNPENFNDENKSQRQMNAFFDVDAAANSHDGRSLKAERSGKKISKTELRQFKEKRKQKKEEKRRAWLRD